MHQQFTQVLIRDVVQRSLDGAVLPSVREVIRGVAAIRQAVHISAFADQEFHKLEVLQVHG
ncbi:Ecotin [Clarias magur]|uniref:Ecotin n=1 Tax=Clarias magur TaxID=1594786 RepID=A0A8J4TIQ9_CLAMG|nr:Ecotin [Clarias magur]